MGGDFLNTYLRATVAFQNTLNRFQRSISSGPRRHICLRQNQAMPPADGFSKQQSRLYLAETIFT